MSDQSPDPLKALREAAEHFRHCELAGTSIESRCPDCVDAGG